MPLQGPAGDYIQLIWELADGINLTSFFTLGLYSVLLGLTFLKVQCCGGASLAATAGDGSRLRGLLHREFQPTDKHLGRIMLFSEFLLDK